MDVGASPPSNNTNDAMMVYQNVNVDWRSGNTLTSKVDSSKPGPYVGKLVVAYR